MIVFYCGAIKNDQRGQRRINESLMFSGAKMDEYKALWPYLSKRKEKDALHRPSLCGQYKREALCKII